MTRHFLETCQDEWGLVPLKDLVGPSHGWPSDRVQRTEEEELTNGAFGHVRRAQRGVLSLC